MNAPISTAKDILEFKLNSFVRRTQDTNRLKALIQDCEGVLSRQGRSRNWRLHIPHPQLKRLVGLIYQADEASWLWLAKLLSEYKANHTFDELLAIAKQHSSITINELMAMTDCSIAEARQVLDALEWLE